MAYISSEPATPSARSDNNKSESVELSMGVPSVSAEDIVDSDEIERKLEMENKFDRKFTRQASKIALEGRQEFRLEEQQELQEKGGSFDQDEVPAWASARYKRF